jgi:hypothetical protein
MALWISGTSWRASSIRRYIGIFFLFDNAAVQAIYRCSVSAKFHEWYEGAMGNAYCALWSMELRDIHPNCRTQSNIGLLTASSSYHVIFIRGAKEDQDAACSVSAVDGLFYYEGLWQVDICILSSKSPSSGQYVINDFYSIGTLVCCLVKRNQLVDSTRPTRKIQQVLPPKSIWRERRCKTVSRSRDECCCHLLCIVLVSLLPSY